MKYQIAIIGGGPAGYTAAETAGKAGLSVVLFEKQSLGGVCLNEGCIPTKPLFVHDRCAVIVSLQTSYLIESKDNDRSKS